MSNTQLIVDFLNSLIEAQPEIAALLNSGIVANEKINALESINTRPCVDGNSYLTFTGIIGAIGQILGDPIAGVYDIEDGCHRLDSFITETDQLSYGFPSSHNPVLLVSVVATTLPERMQEIVNRT